MVATVGSLGIEEQQNIMTTCKIRAQARRVNEAFLYNTGDSRESHDAIAMHNQGSSCYA